MKNVAESAARAKSASRLLAAVTAERKDHALEAVAASLERSAAQIFAANRRDMELAEREQLAPPLRKRLGFGEEKLREVLDGIHSLVSLPDPSGRVLSARELDEGLELFQVSCPIGVIGVIFESRPDALVQISTLCLKSGNAVLLKGGREAAETNRALAAAIEEGAREAGIPDGWIQLLETREEVREMLALDRDIDLIVPRGSNEFVRRIMQESSIPVLGHADGICHLFVDRDADIGMAVRVAVDSKTQYVAVCNALETLLVDTEIAERFLPEARRALEAKGVELRGCARTRTIIDVAPATDEDWATEYLDLILSIKVVDGLEEAIEHINRFGSGHTDGIVTASRDRAIRFMDLVDSADLMWNCSTRFSDGYRYGLGAEVGISTNKIHARGPVGLEGLVIYKWKLLGGGQVVSDYSGDGGRRFTHRPLEGRRPPEAG